MPDSLADLEQRREVIAKRIAGLGDLRPGSITGTSGRCGKPECHCHQPGQPGHGPNFRLTYKVDGKTISEALPTPAAIQKAEREVEEFRKFQQLTREFLGTNAEICRLRPLEDEAETELKKNGRSDPARNHARNRTVLAGGVPGSAQHGAHRSGSDRNGHAFGSTPCGYHCVEPTAAIPSPERGRAHAGLPLRPTSPLPRAAQQAGADRRGPGGSFTSYYLCAHCGTGQFPVDVELDIENTEFSPGVRRMQAMVCQEAPSDHGREQMKILAGLEVTTKSVERTAEAIGADIAQREQAEIQKALQLELPVVAGESIPVLYEQMDGTGIPVVKKETVGRQGKSEGQPAHTREVNWDASSPRRRGIRKVIQSAIPIPPRKPGPSRVRKSLAGESMRKLVGAAGAAHSRRL